MSEPLQPISSPFTLLAQAGISMHGALAFIFMLALALWVLFTLVALYHWIRYSHAALLALPALLAHFLVSGVLILFTWSALSGL